MELTREKYFKENLEKTFQTATVSIPREKRISIQLRSDLVAPFLSYAQSYLGFTHFAHMSCVDWIEDKEFELVFILWNYDEQIQIIAKTRIDREKPEFVTIKHFWPQAETYEREIHEMYGIHFEGNNRLGEFILEDWEEIPPMRRDFISEDYAKETFWFRPGREDAQDVRDTIAERSGEEIPEFARPYSVRKKE